MISRLLYIVLYKEISKDILTCFIAKREVIFIEDCSYTKKSPSSFGISPLELF